MVLQLECYFLGIFNFVVTSPAATDAEWAVIRMNGRLGDGGPARSSHASTLLVAKRKSVSSA